MTTFIIKYHSMELQRITAKSIRAAKIRTSKYCSNDAKLYSLLCGIQLCNEYGDCISMYAPYFGQWFDISGVVSFSDI